MRAISLFTQKLNRFDLLLNNLLKRIKLFINQFTLANYLIQSFILITTIKLSKLNAFVLMNYIGYLLLFLRRCCNLYSSHKATTCAVYNKSCEEYTVQNKCHESLTLISLNLINHWSKHIINI